MVYQILIKPAARKELAKLDDDARQRVAEAISRLAIDPRPNGARKLKGRDGYRVRVGDYRVLYTIADQVLQILVVQVGHRREVYRG